MKNEKKSKNKLIKNIFACIVGFINGFFGGGGGLICVPTLENIYKLDSKKSHATSIAIIFPISIISSLIYIINNKIDYFNMGAVTVGVILGGMIGAFALKKSSSSFVRWLFILVLYTVGVRMLV